LAALAPAHDVVVFFTYLYWPTWTGLPLASALVPTVFHPTAHDEPQLYLPLFDTTFRQPAAFGFLTEEEERLVRRRFKVDQPSAVLGVGVQLDRTGGDGGSLFRSQTTVRNRPYLVCVGRVDSAKGADELFEFFVAYKSRRPGPLALAFIGDPARPLPSHPDVVLTGVVDDVMKRSALDGAVALVQPSYFESFSMILTEAWARRKPALVQGHCDVLVGQSVRSGGGLPFQGYASFEAALDRLTEDENLRRSMGVAGYNFVNRFLGWSGVLDRYESLLADVCGRRS
jgi:glycosyltransferase involved in cell wall biosynthesis